MSLIFFAALAGAVQVVAPDRWMPASILAWQRGWKNTRIAGFSILIFAVHVLLGYLLYELFLRLPIEVTEDSIGVFSLIFLTLIGVIRVYRFSRIHEVLYRTTNPRSAVISVISLLGPSEMVIPVLYKARIDGAPQFPMLLALLAGTCIAGFANLLIARTSWNRPMVLPRTVLWCKSKTAALPMATGALIGLMLIAMRAIT